MNERAKLFLSPSLDLWEVYMRAMPVILIAGLAACASDFGLPASSGPTTTITSVTRTPDGYALTIQVSNSDTGAIGYNPYCPGKVMERVGQWRTVTETEQICRMPEKTVDAGTSRTFVFNEPNIGQGGEIRFVFSWTWFNGNGPTGGESVSAPVTVQ